MSKENLKTVANMFIILNIIALFIIGVVTFLSLYNAMYLLLLVNVIPLVWIIVFTRYIIRLHKYAKELGDKDEID